MQPPAARVGRPSKRSRQTQPSIKALKLTRGWRVISVSSATAQVGKTARRAGLTPVPANP
jgi:hypothetical protein